MDQKIEFQAAPGRLEAANCRSPWDNGDGPPYPDSRGTPQANQYLRRAMLAADLAV
jgi:hypothetical protein